MMLRVDGRERRRPVRAASTPAVMAARICPALSSSLQILKLGRCRVDDGACESRARLAPARETAENSIWGSCRRRENGGSRFGAPIQWRNAGPFHQRPEPHRPVV